MPEVGKEYLYLLSYLASNDGQQVTQLARGRQRMPVLSYLTSNDGQQVTQLARFSFKNNKHTIDNLFGIFENAPKKSY